MNKSLIDALLWAFEYVYHQDCAQAKLEFAPMGYSQLTIRLAESLAEVWPEDEPWTSELTDVLYQLDVPPKAGGQDGAA